VNWKLFVTILLGLALLGGRVLLARRGDGTTGGPPGLDLRAGWWVLPWFAGLALISWLGVYSSDGADHGQLGLLGLGWGFVVVALFSLLVHALALRSRLPDAVTRGLVAGQGDGAAVRAG
jgi:hypothetical protein